MRPLTLSFPPEDLERLKLIASDLGLSVAALVREVVNDHLLKDERTV